MTKSKIQSAWKKVIKETHKIPNWKVYKRNHKQYQKLVMLRGLLLFCQVLLGKIQSDDNRTFNTLIFKKTMKFYCAQIKNYV